RGDGGGGRGVRGEPGPDCRLPGRPAGAHRGPGDREIAGVAMEPCTCRYPPCGKAFAPEKPSYWWCCYDHYLKDKERLGPPLYDQGYRAGYAAGVEASRAQAAIPVELFRPLVNLIHSRTDGRDGPSDLTNFRSKNNLTRHEHLATVNDQPREVSHTFNNAVFRVFEYFLAREAIYLC